MSMHFKALKSPRFIFYIVFAGFFGLAPVQAATPSLLTVENVKIDVSADNALMARDQAFIKAQAEAYKALAVQLNPAQKPETVQLPAASVLAGMVRDYEVTQEKLSSKRYSATYTFRFKESAVRRQFGSEIVDAALHPSAPPSADYAGAPAMSAVLPDPAPAPMTAPAASSQSQTRYLILPFYQQGADMALWAEDNDWLREWGRHAGGGFAVPVGDAQDVAAIGDNQALSYDRARLDEMLTRYGAREAVFIVAFPGNENGLRTLDISLYRTDRGAPELARKLRIEPAPGMDAAQIMQGAIDKVKAILNQDWKQGGAAASMASGAAAPDMAFAGPAGLVRARVIFNDFQDWASLQRAIMHDPGVREITLQSLSTREAGILITLKGNDLQSLRDTLGRQNIVLSGGPGDNGNAAPGAAIYSIYRGAGASAAMRQTAGGTAPPSPPVYSRSF